MISPARWRAAARRHQALKRRLWTWGLSLVAFLLLFNILPLARTRVGYFLSLLLLMAVSELFIAAGSLSFFGAPRGAKPDPGGRSKKLDWAVALGAPLLLILVPILFLRTLYGQIVS